MIIPKGVFLMIKIGDAELLMISSKEFVDTCMEIYKKGNWPEGFFCDNVGPFLEWFPKTGIDLSKM